MLFEIVGICKGGGYRYARTNPPHPKANAKGLYPLHRVRAENKIGRLLTDDEIVHHVDGNSENDTDDNLAVMSRAGHSRHHAIGRYSGPVAADCAFCGKQMSVEPGELRYRVRRNVSGKVFCSISCGAKYQQHAK